MTHTIDTLILDLGGVLIDVDYTASASAFHALGFPDFDGLYTKARQTDLFDRFEFTHGHNVLLFNGILRFPGLSPKVRPYVGAGAGVAVPHVEVWFKGEKLENRTNEYQYAGPAAQAFAGVEFRVGRLSYYIEYKFSWASITGALTGNESWKNFNLPGDLLRQFLAWWNNENPAYGGFSTTLSAHQIAGGVGFRLTSAPAPPAP